MLAVLHEETNGKTYISTYHVYWRQLIHKQFKENSLSGTVSILENIFKLELKKEM
jgi:hypothetical protein